MLAITYAVKSGDGAVRYNILLKESTECEGHDCESDYLESRNKTLHENGDESIVSRQCASP